MAEQLVKQAPEEAVYSASGDGKYSPPAPNMSLEMALMAWRVRDVVQIALAMVMPRRGIAGGWSRPRLQRVSLLP